MGNMEVISVNLWQMLASLANLLILFLIFKKLLFKPVQSVLDKRRAAIESDYAAADAANTAALASQAEYEEKLSHAEHETSEMRKNAADEAKRHAARIVAEAKEDAEGIVRAAHEQIELDKKKAESDVKREIAAVSTMIAGKLIEREVNEKDHSALIDSAINSIGDE